MTQSTFRRPVSRLQGVLLAASLLLAIASASAAQMNLATRPLYAGGNVPPIVMIDLSKDHSLHQKAYNDYTDLDNDGILDATYTNAIKYAGYFDSGKCYTYDSNTIKGFVPSFVMTADTQGQLYCDGKSWSGNFLNWVSMSRIDEVRKILYGGTRATDTATTTVLERAFLPMDAHAWAKYYAGADLRKLVPSSMVAEMPSDVGLLTSNSTVTMKPTYGDILTINVSDSSKIEVGDQIRMVPSSTSAPKNVSMTGWATKTGKNTVTIAIYPESVFTSTGRDETYTNWNVANLSRGGLTFCNVTPRDGSGVQASQDNTQAPQIRVANGNYATWGASEKWQCNWTSEASNTQGSFLPYIITDPKNNTQVRPGGSSSGNRAALSGINSSAENPSRDNRGAGTGEAKGTFNARVQVCVADATLRAGENCKQYGTSYKPVGLLQKYGETGQMLFGLMTGSYDKNISGGVLRQNATNFATEINPADGTFATGTVKGIVWNIDRLRPYGYSYRDGGYTSGDTGVDACNYQQTGITLSGGANAQGKPANQGNCSTWGNPISEIYLETLRYLAGKSSNSDFLPKTDGKDAALKLTTATWANPMNLPANDPKRAPYCTPLNALVFNSSVSSYDGDQLAGFADLNSSNGVSKYTDTVGTTEGVTGKWFAGGVTGGLIDNLCSAKDVANFSDVLGICPEGPSQAGTFQIAGAAYFAHTNRIRSDINIPAGDTKSLKVSTYAVQLATTTPRINVNVNGQTVTILPSYQLHPDNIQPSSGTLVDFKVISQTPTSGRFYVNWEDSIAGGDYDQDVWGILSYNVVGDKITVSTRVVSASTSNGQGFGYAISGTDKDGPHFHSGIYNFKYTDPATVVVSPKSAPINTSGGCQNCNIGDPETSVTYTANGKAGGQFQDPLFYAAKWGGFSEDKGGNGLADNVLEWDTRKADGSAGADGLPDNYFYATNPAALSDSLERAFINILNVSSAASVATNSATLTTGSAIFQALFNGSDWSGKLIAFPIDLNGQTGNATWDAGDVLNTQTSATRQILTYDNVTANKAGIPFKWDRLPAAYQTLLSQNRLEWMRGDRSHEGGSDLRSRPNTILGDIVNSSPQYVAAPNAGYADADYAAFVVQHRDRRPVLYVGANDGMLHAFDAHLNAADGGGRELFAYVPSALYGSLSTLSNPGYVHRYYVDGTPTVGDAKVNGTWRTILVGGLAGGGRGIFALDVTDPDAINEGSAASTALWEFTNNQDADLGYTYGQPNIVRLGNGKWAAVFGNGYNSNAGRGSIFIVFLDRAAGSKSWSIGTDYLKLTVDDANITVPNGISAAFPADVNGDGTTDFLYAGDLLGNLWKFDVSGTDPATWQGTRKLLFTATDANGKRQPITSAVDVMRNTQAGGYMVLFGTGSYVDNADPSNFSTQSFYGIWDQNNTAQGTVTRSKLVQQTIDAEAQFPATKVLYRLVSRNNVQYTATGKQGWYMDLLKPPYPPGTAEGERVVYDPQIRGTRIVFTTLIPSTDQCASGGTSWLMELDGVSGGRLTQPPFDANNDGRFDQNDLVNGQQPGGVQPANGITPRPTILIDGTKERKVLNGSTGETQVVTESAGSPLGRLSWREILH